MLGSNQSQDLKQNCSVRTGQKRRKQRLPESLYFSMCYLFPLFTWVWLLALVLKKACQSVHLNYVTVIVHVISVLLNYDSLC